VTGLREADLWRERGFIGINRRFDQRRAALAECFSQDGGAFLRIDNRISSRQALPAAQPNSEARPTPNSEERRLV
jgi:hypothetical protein